MKISRHPSRARRSLGFALAASLAGCASTGTSPQSDPRDPWEGWNREVQSFNDKLDDYMMKPVARGYQYITPSIVDQGVTNFFSNVDDVAVIGNDLLQFKLLQTGQDVGRLVVNTTLGLGGFVDVAKHLSMPKHNEDLDQTLGAWGIPSGPYLVLPFIGPSTPRGVVGVAGDTMSNPINWINPVGIPWGSGVLKTTDMRADLLSATKIMDEASVDRYEFMRNAYFQQRKYLIYDGNPPMDEDLEKEMDLELEGLDSGGSTPPPSVAAPMPTEQQPAETAGK
ncbi:MlaA family lipoprotein [Methylomagnum ishizawai]|uniref:MlaA family lipoprotein n=1 Tax=Methylomagnum ishizawai TaxID=1760988 RepID=UPI001C32FCDD|nr:VacJ family lipoprotein [Methylomagnum ishizawai]BBL73021.1 hypothetical protein MishRS11D_01190 [Methylomagnum ishizawai]